MIRPGAATSLPRRRGRLVALVAVLGLLAGVLVGCSSTTPSVGQLYKQARETALAAKSGTLKGKVTQGGKEITLSITGQADGSNQLVEMTVDGGKATILTVDGKSYMKGDEAFWKGSGSGEMASVVGDKYIAMSSANAQKDAFTLGSMLKELFDDKQLSTMESLTTSVEETNLDGVKAYVLKGKVQDDGAVYVSADGKATLLKLVGPTSQPGELAFSDWNAAPTQKAPPADQVLTP